MDVIDAIRQAGVVGAGGAGFPTHVKLAVQAGQVIVNGAECEPLLKVDQLAMERQAQKVVRGLELAMEAAQAQEGVLATKAHYRHAVEALKGAISGKPRLRLHLMESYYPSGDEKSVIYEITGQVVPTGKLPIDTGCVVVNVGTALGIADAVEGRPVTGKTLTLCGDVPQPMTVTVPIGVSLREALSLSGFTGKEEEYALILGGPCMGNLAESWEDPVTKTTGGILALKRSHMQIQMRTITVEQQARLARAICCQCNRCTQICPRHAMGLPVEPHKAMRAISTGNAELLGSAAGVLACSSCGLCTYYGCEMGLTPSVVMTMLKQELGKAGVRPVPEARIVPEPWMALKAVPLQRLVARMHLSAFDVPAPYSGKTLSPQTVRIPLRQHVGRAAQAVVKAGERVRKGQLIGSIPDNALGAAVHASISGQVAQVTGQMITLTRE
ncbi:MAG: 4Fe-4S dicluster domain-containing protein [Candidatus Limiplasma sp.]|nr:4Fe-4S dicluster domain-containing protein [Candidatus Limiplasma sp.]